MLVNPEDVESEEEEVQSLTQRLRCLFTVLTVSLKLVAYPAVKKGYLLTLLSQINKSRHLFPSHLTCHLQFNFHLFLLVQLPIIPIGTALSFLLLFVLYAAFVTDLHRQCSAPLHGYAIISLILFLYAPNHRAIKYHLFHYSRERDGPNRPRSVRVYDQAFQTICILYVYFGMTLIQTCVDDTTTVPTDDGDGGHMSENGGDGSGAGSVMANAVGLGVQSSATMDSDTATAHARTMSTCEATCPSLYASTKTFVATLQIFFLFLIMPLLMLPCIYVWVVRRASAVAALAELGRAGRDDFDGEDDGGGRSYTVREILNGMDIVSFVSFGASGNNSSEKVKIVTLSDGVPPGGDVEEGLGLGNGSAVVTNAPSSRMPSYRDRDDVRECCICMAEFRLDDAELPEELAQLARNRDVMGAADVPNTAIRTRCGHYFHVRCLSGCIGGQWTGEGSDGNRTMESQRVRRRACPPCRENLAPSGSRRGRIDGSTRAQSHVNYGSCQRENCLAWRHVYD